MANTRTIHKLLDEIDLSAKDKSRTISDISDKDIKNMIVTGSGVALSSGVTASIMAGLGTTATGTAIGSAMGGMTGAVSAASFATIGAGAGSIIPGLGTILGFIFGLLTGGLISIITKNINKKERESLRQEILIKQNTKIRELQKEVEELVAKNKTLAEQNERYRYIVGILAANEELKRSIA